MVVMRSILKDLEVFKDNTVYNYNFNIDVDYLNSDKFILKDDTITFLMKNPESIMGNLWENVVTQKEQNGIYEVNFSTQQYNDALKTIKKVPNCGAELYYTIPLEQDEVVYIKKSAYFFEKYSVSFFLYNKEYYEFLKNRFYADIDGVDISKKIYCGYRIENGIHQFMYIEQGANRYETRSLKDYAVLSINARKVIVDDIAYALPKVTAEHNMLGLEIREKHTDRNGNHSIKLDDILYVGSGMGRIEFKEIRLEKRLEKIKLICVSCGNVILEQYDYINNKWIELSRPHKNLHPLSNGVIKIRAKMEFGAKIKQLMLCAD